VNNNLTVGGNIDFGDAVAIGLGGSTANTNLQVGGGIITNSDTVACKRYAHTFERTTGESYDVQFHFGEASFYAKIVAVLRRIDGSIVNDSSTLILEVQGGSHDGSLSTVPIKIGTQNLFGGTNQYPWSTTVTTGSQGIVITPVTILDRTYSYDIFVELMSSRGGALVNLLTNNQGVDVFEGEQLVNFGY
jgi:hypothetical protein